MKTKISMCALLTIFTIKSQSQILSMPLDNNTSDISGHNNHGLVKGTLTNANNRFGTPNSAYHFPGTNSDYIYIPTNITTYDFNITLSDSISISLWMQPEDNSSQQCIFAKRDTSWFLFQQSDFDIQMGQQQAIISSNLGPTYNADYNDYTAPTPQKWYHVVLTYKNGLAQMYVNDTLRGSNTNPPIDSIASTIVIGRYYKGEIDDINVYHKQLSASEVDQLFKIGIATDVAIHESNDNKIFIYPNPTSQYINIYNNTNEVTEIIIYDVIGKTIFTEKTLEKNKQLNLQEYNNGIYYVRLSNTTSTTTHKIIVQK